MEVLRIEPRVSHMLGKCFNTELDVNTWQSCVTVSTYNHLYSMIVPLLNLPGVPDVFSK